MTEYLHLALRWSHIIMGSIGLVLFWMAALTRKGGDVHKAIGRWFVRATYFVGVSAAVSCLWGMLHPTSFTGDSELSQNQIQGIRFFLAILIFLASLVLSAVTMGTRVLRVKSDHASLSSPFLVTVIVFQALSSLVAITVGAHGRFALGLGPEYFIPLGLGCFGLLDVLGSWRLIRRRPEDKMWWFYNHIECMLGCGTGFHTAFAVTLFNRVIPLRLEGLFALLPWILPPVIGGIATHLVIKKYKARFNTEKADSTPNVVGSLHSPNLQQDQVQ